MQLESYAAAVSSLILFPYVVNRGIHASTLIDAVSVRSSKGEPSSLAAMINAAQHLPPLLPTPNEPTEHDDTHATQPDPQAGSSAPETPFFESSASVTEALLESAQHNAQMHFVRRILVRRARQLTEDTDMPTTTAMESSTHGCITTYGEVVTVDLSGSSAWTCEIRRFYRDPSDACAEHITDYRIVCDPASAAVAIRVEHDHNNTTNSISSDVTQHFEAWTSKTLLPKVVKWYQAALAGRMPTVNCALIDREQYVICFNDLKQRFALELVQSWRQFECTDPAKYIYEELAIAAYVVCLWQQQRVEQGSERMQSFVDLGCGNGVLVYFLNMAGHPGYGVDGQRRKVWSFFEERGTTFKEEMLNPLEYDCSTSDWLLGNHSDELTPWLPWMAAHASYSCAYLVLPCCFYEFHGGRFDESKYRASTPQMGRYAKYLEFLEAVGVRLGFEVQTDSLKIPSPKRICHIGQRRTYPQQDHTKMLSVHLEMVKGVKEKLKLRAMPSEAVLRNGALISAEAKHTMVMKVMWGLLRREEDEKGSGGVGERQQQHKRKRSEWRRGGCLTIGDALRLLDDADLSVLRNQNGGLQALLRNHGHVFLVQKGTVQLQDMRVPDSERAPPLRGKSKSKKPRPTATTITTTTGTAPASVPSPRPCWFFRHHPDGCPLDRECSKLHE